MKSYTCTQKDGFIELSLITMAKHEGVASLWENIYNLFPTDDDVLISVIN